MNEELQEQLVKRFTNRFSKFNEKVLEELGQAIKQIGDLTPSDAYKLAQQLKYNTTVRDLEQELSRITGKSIEEIQKILEYVAKENIAFSKPFYEAKSLNVPIYEYHGELQRIVNSMAKLSAESFVNIARSTGFRLLDTDKKPMFFNLEETYHKVIDEAVYAVTTGKESYNQLMRDTLRQLAHSGVRKIEYESGYTRRIDTVVRMNVMDSIRQVSNESQSIFGKEFGADGVEITVHVYPAPDHAHAQGRQFSHKEFEKFQNHEKCRDYHGHVYHVIENRKQRRAISEYNCYHVANQVVLGISKPLYSDAELQKIIDDNNKGIEIDGKQYTIYEATQLQRRIETEIRKSKEENILAKVSGDDELVLSSQQRITSLVNKYKQISKQANLAIDVDRTYVPNYKPKKVKNTLSYEDVTKEWIVKAEPRKGNIINRNYYVDKKGNKYNVDGKNVVFEPSNDEIETANFIHQTFGGNIYLNPKINMPEDVESSDYLWKNQLWDKKIIGKNATSLKRTVDNAIKKHKEQTDYIFLDVTNSKIEQSILIEQTKKIFSTKGREWVKGIMIINNNKVIGIYIRNKRG